MSRATIRAARVVSDVTPPRFHTHFAARWREARVSSAVPGMSAWHWTTPSCDGVAPFQTLYLILSVGLRYHKPRYPNFSSQLTRPFIRPWRRRLVACRVGLSTRCWCARWPAPARLRLERAARGRARRARSAGFQSPMRLRALLISRQGLTQLTVTLAHFRAQLEDLGTHPRVQLGCRVSLS